MAMIPPSPDKLKSYYKRHIKEIESTRNGTVKWAEKTIVEEKETLKNVLLSDMTIHDWINVDSIGSLVGAATQFDRTTVIGGSLEGDYERVARSLMIQGRGAAMEALICGHAHVAGKLHGGPGLNNDYAEGIVQCLSAGDIDMATRVFYLLHEQGEAMGCFREEHPSVGSGDMLFGAYRLMADWLGVEPVLASDILIKREGYLHMLRDWRTENKDQLIAMFVAMGKMREIMSGSSNNRVGYAFGPLACWVPDEIFAVFRLREQLGLWNPEPEDIPHMLLQTPVAHYVKQPVINATTEAMSDVLEFVRYYVPRLQDYVIPT